MLQTACTERNRSKSGSQNPHLHVGNARGQVLVLRLPKVRVREARNGVLDAFDLTGHHGEHLHCTGNAPIVCIVVAHVGERLPYNSLSFEDHSDTFRRSIGFINRQYNTC